MYVRLVGAASEDDAKRRKLGAREGDVEAALWDGDGGGGGGGGGGDED